MTKNSMNRREFGRIAGAAGVVGAASIAGAPKVHAAKPQVVVIGGGPGGATVAHYLAKDSKGAIDVTLVEANKMHTTCFFSNLYLGGFRDFASITHGYGKLAKMGVKVVHAWAKMIDAGKKQVVLADGTALGYDACVVSPGIDFKWDTIEGYDAEVAKKIPHAWQAGPQTRMLKQQLEAMADGGTFVIAPPPNPFRCPPGPYERVCMVAHYMKTHKPKSKIIVFDAKNKFSKQALFQDGWAKHYPGMIEWVPAEISDGGVKSVDAGAMTVTAGGEKTKGAVINIIPAQKAGAIAFASGLTNDSGWCPVTPGTMESKNAPGVYVLGDSSIASAMPKSGFSANSQAKVCALAVRHALTGSKTFPPRYRNTCWSLISPNNGIKVGASYKDGGTKIAKISGFISKVGEDDDVRGATASEANGWYDAITKDIFG